ncbi:HAD family hydrolase [Roseobacter sp.]|uniref:D-glycero-alpha-D-manno-heptose-1,7-bisphosphate 7-phosphatase n=1 Tax=Roseobacter sp. TaxID=1907202 RepID=UPI0032970CA3
MTDVPALFLDRDGVVNTETHFCHRVADFDLRPGVFTLVRHAHRAGYPVVVVTNQSGLARGIFTDADYATLTDHMRGLFADAGCPLTDVLHCPFHADAAVATYRVANHPWRKPNPGMLLEAQARHGVDLSRSVLVGDRTSDMGAAAAAGLAAACFVGRDMPGDIAAPRVLAQVADTQAAAAWYGAWLADP